MWLKFSIGTKEERGRAKESGATCALSLWGWSCVITKGVFRRYSFHRRSITKLKESRVPSNDGQEPTKDGRNYERENVYILLKKVKEALRQWYATVSVRELAVNVRLSLKLKPWNGCCQARRWCHDR